MHSLPLLILGLLPTQDDLAREAYTLLADRCFPCHGPDANKRKGDLRLDERTGALALRKEGAAIEPGSAASSLLAARIEEAPDKRMPPPRSKLVLSAEERKLLREWIDAGAEYPRHWAFAALTKQRTAEPNEGDPIDQMVAESLERAGHEVADEVSPAIWLRRATLVLTGLPPTLTELDAFETAPVATRKEEAVTRLLASPRMGEHLAAPWLDAARYADTYGYQSDVYRAVWPYRDWVIEAFNRNLPYDSFLVEQIAGDLLPGATQDQIVATAFNRLHRQTNEGGSVEEEFRSEYVADRVNTLGTAVMGLTMTCSRCHDHKYDPIPQKDYYSLAAFFDNIDESGLYSHFTNAVPTPTLDLTTADQAKQLDELRETCARLEQELDEFTLDQAAYAAWRTEQELSASAPAGLVGSYLMDEGQGAALKNQVPDKLAGGVHGPVNRVEDHPGGGLLLSGDHALTFVGNPAFRRWDPLTFGLWVSPREDLERAVVLHRSRAWHDAGSRGFQLLLEEGRPSFSLIHFWPGNAVRVRAVDAIEIGAWTHLGITHDGSGRAAGICLYVNGIRVECETVRDHLTRTIVGGGEAHLTIGERFRDRGFRNGAVDDLHVFDRELTPAEVALMARLDKTGQITGWQDPAIRKTHWSEASWQAAFEGSPGDKLREAKRAELRQARKSLAEFVDQLPSLMIMRESPTPRTTRVLARGAYDQPGEAVQPDSLSCLPPMHSDGTPSRLDLARWLVREDHPLTSRVAVDRFWRLIFGAGLVGTPENFGVQGVGPWNPELLDTLARDFMASGWNVKQLLRRLVLSETFARKTCAIPGADPRRRLSAEALRDQALFHSGLLVEKTGGPSVKPYQPAGLWKEKSGKVYAADQGAGLYRRSLYTFWKLTSPPPSMLLLDAAKRDVCSVNRPETSTPLQALVFWNDPQFVEASRVMAAEVLSQDASREERINMVFRRMTSHVPNNGEVQAIAALLQISQADYNALPDQAQAVLGVGATATTPELDQGLHASWTLVISTLFSHHGVVSLQ